MSQSLTPAELPRPEPQHDGPRESVWSVRRKHADTFFATLFTLWIAMACLVTTVHLQEHSGRAVPETAEWTARRALDILLDVGVATVPVVMISMILNRPLTIVGAIIVITYRTAEARWITPKIQQHRAKGKAEGLAEGKAEGIAEGKAKGIAEANARWEDWWARRQAAEEAGIPFDEPPPSVSGN